MSLGHDKCRVHTGCTDARVRFTRQPPRSSRSARSKRTIITAAPRSRQRVNYTFACEPVRLHLVGADVCGDGDGDGDRPAAMHCNRVQGVRVNNFDLRVIGASVGW